MGELRKDYFTERLVIVSAERSKRISELKEEEQPLKSECPFCPGNERMTPPADLVLVEREGTLLKLTDSEFEVHPNWSVRVFPQAASSVSLNPPSTYSDSPLYSEPAYGYHYIVVATPNHEESFSKMSVDQWMNVLATTQDKMRWLYSQKRVSYVAVFVNNGRDAGASIPHPHLQLLTLPRLPPLVEEEATAVQKSMYELGICPMCSVVGAELGGPRQILATDSFVSFSPWAPTHAFEFWIFPKRHQTSFLKVAQKEIRDLALMLRSTLGGLSRALNEPAFSMVFHTSPEKKTTKQLHWHIEVYPQLTRWSGLEKGAGVYINQIPPEQAAEVLGMNARKELASLIGIS